MFAEVWVPPSHENIQSQNIINTQRLVPEGGGDLAQAYLHFLLTKQQQLQSNWFLLLCSPCTFMFSVHRPWQWTQLSLDHSGSIMVGRMGEYCWTDQIATPKDAIGVLLVGGESCHPASPTPFVQCWSNLWVEKFVGFNGREEDKNRASKAFISKLKINSWAWAAWTNRQIPCLVPVSLCQLKHLHHCTKKL